MSEKKIKWFDINNVQPLNNMTAIVRTNWKTYRALFIKSEFGSYSFLDIKTLKTIQLSVVTGWSFTY